MSSSSRPVLHWQESGPRDADVLLLVHGFPFSSAMWRPQLESLPLGWRVVAPDLRGFGASPAAGTDVLTMDAMADDLAALLDELGVRTAVFCGLSMGGYIAFAMLRRHAARLRALVLCDTRPGADTDEARRGRLEGAALVTAQGTAPLIDSLLPKLLSAETRRDRPEVEQEVREMMQAQPAETVAAALRGMAARPDSTPLLRSIVVPTRIIVGAADQITPVGEAQLMARAIPGALLEVIPDAGHMPNLENQDAFDRVLDGFLLTLP
jgi:3-oxoadipate enol-lactonase